MSIIINGDTGVSGVDGSAATPSLQGTDTNTGIFYPAADTIAFAEGGVEAMRIDSSGNVGIGVTPSAWTGGFKPLQILSSSIAGYDDGAGNIQTEINTNLYQSSLGTYNYIKSYNALQYRQLTGAGHLWYTAPNGTAGAAVVPTERMRIDTSGNVGIGTASPAAKLDVMGQGMFQGSTLPSYKGALIGALNINNNSADGTVDFTQGIVFTDNSNNLGAWSHAGIVSTGSTNFNGNLVFGTDGGGTSAQQITERMRIDSSGYVTNAVNGLGNGIVQAQQYYRLNSGVVGANVNTAQNIFGVGVTLIGSTQYEFEISILLAKTVGATSHTVGFGFGGTATLNNILYELKGSASTTATFTINGSVYTSGANNTATNTVLTAAIASATANVWMNLKGTVSVNAGGTFIPQYTLSAAPGGAYTTQIGSYIKIAPLAASGANVSIGTWA